MADIRQTLEIQASPGRVYEALVAEKELRRWWTETCMAEAREGSYSKFAFEPVAAQTVRVERLIPSRIVEWSCVDGVQSGQCSPWIGTRVRFELSGEGDRTTLSLSHGPFRSRDAGFEQVNQGWAHFLENSLKRYLEGGEGATFQSTGSRCPSSSCGAN